VVRRKKKSTSLSIDTQVSQEVLGIAWLAFAVLSFFSLRGSAGLFGEWFSSDVLIAFFGIGASVVPLIFIGIGLAYLFFKKIEYKGMRALGLFFLVASILGIVHLSAPPDALFETAPEFGGYIGFVSSFITLYAFGETSAGFLLGAITFVSIFLIFQFSIRDSFLLAASFIRGNKAITSSVQKPRSPSIKKEAPKVADEDSLTEEDVNIIRGIEKAVEKAGTEQVASKENVKKDASVQETVKQAQESEAPAIKDNSKFSTDKSAYTSRNFVDWKFPPYDLLVSQTARSVQDDEKLLADAETIRKKLLQFGITVTMKDVNVGPTVIQYTFKPAEDVKLSKITSLKSDLALALAAKAIRIEAPVPGRSLVGVEIPTADRAIVTLRDLIESKEFNGLKDPLRLILGRDVTGKAICASLATMPHLLVAGQTGSGKSVAINAFMMSLLYKHSPSELKLIVVDPKRVEMTGYNGIPHLLTPVINEPEKALKALKWAVAEMTRRYKELSHRKKRNITEYNADKSLERMPFIVIVIDELADLMMAASKEIEATICRLAQMARAVGIHLIIATQRPSVDVITGLIKANIPTRIAFTVATGIDSRTILDGVGAEDLLNRGDMLYLASDIGKPMRVQGAFVSSEEINRVINHVKLNAPDAIEYVEEITEGEHKVSIPGMPVSKGDTSDSDIQKSIEVIKQYRKASASLLQRRCSFGYAKAARILDELEEMGLIGPSNGAKPREIYME
jgi:S-DNA-T family DNA segregation ATPase FtsK/SpoIIIE